MEVLIFDKDLNMDRFEVVCVFKKSLVNVKMVLMVRYDDDDDCFLIARKKNNTG